MPPAAAAMHKETSGASVKLKDPQISPSSFGGSTSTVTKPSALRMPSPSVGFFNQVANFLPYQVTCNDFTSTFVVNSFTAIFICYK